MVLELSCPYCYTKGKQKIQVGTSIVSLNPVIFELLPRGVDTFLLTAAASKGSYAMVVSTWGRLG